MDTKALIALGKDAYPKFKNAKKAYAYLKLVRGTLDENTRAGSAFQIGIKFTIDVAGKALGASLSSHPYFTYHKAHLEILGQALNATNVTEQARDAFAKAVGQANASQGLASQVGSLEAMRGQLRFTFVFLYGSLATLKEAAGGATAGLKATGMTEPELRKSAGDLLYEYRCAWAGLADQALALYLMVGAEAAGVTVAMDRYDAKLAALKAGKGVGGNLGRIAAYRLEEDRMWAELEASTRPSPAGRASYDPRGAAKRSVEQVEELTGKICTVVDALFDDDIAYGRPDKLLELVQAP